MARLDAKKDVTIIHATPEDALAAFIARDVDAFGAGLTERVEARRNGGTELLVASDVSPPVIDGLITSEQFARDHRDILDKLVSQWFSTIQFMEKDLATNSKYVLSYLTKSASTRYTPQEYSGAWTFQIFPPTPEAARDLLYVESSPYYWKRAWIANNEFLLRQGKIKLPVPLEAFHGEEVIQRIIDASPRK
jgi:ABC-type nitrate/sulfonate/bicarbonate transport system substrate-binding protein